MDSKLVTGETAPIEIQEAFNTLRTNLCFALSGETSKIIALTGTKNGVGVSTTALNLALSFSQVNNNKVLLIDGDMHSSVLTSKLDLSDKSGFSDCLSGCAGKETCIVSISGIDVLPSGKKPSNPANLLDSKAMEKLCEEFKRAYDYVFIVLPPASNFSDAAITAKFADGFVPVVRHDKTRYAEIKKLVRNIRLAGGKILGFVYNREPLKK